MFFFRRNFHNRKIFDLAPIFEELSSLVSDISCPSLNRFIDDLIEICWEAYLADIFLLVKIPHLFNEKYNERIFQSQHEEMRIKKLVWPGLMIPNDTVLCKCRVLT